MPATVFISWTRLDPHGEAFTDELYKLIAEMDMDPLRDQDKVQNGDEWRGVIDGWLFACDAAIVVLTAHAMASTWVRDELTVLLARKSAHPSFPILPLVVGTTVEELRKCPLAARLLAIQAPMIPVGGGLDPVRPWLEEQRERGVITDWALHRELRRLERVDEAVADQVLFVLDEPVRRWPRAKGRPQRLAVAMREAEQSKWLNAILTLARHDAWISRVELGELVVAFHRMRWVNAIAAAPLAELRQFQAPPPIWLIEASAVEFTANAYVWRACVNVARTRLVAILPTAAESGSLLERVGGGLCQSLQVPESDLGEELAFLARNEQVVLVVIQLNAPTTEEVQRLRTRFPTVPFLIFTDAIPASTTLDVLLPTLAVGAEKEAVRTHRAALANTKPV